MQDAHYVRPEAFATALTLAVVLLSLPERRWQTWRQLAGALCVGLLIACKISMVLLIWLPFVPTLAAWRDRRSRWLLGMIPFAILVGFVGGAPGAVINPRAFMNGVQHLTTQYAGVFLPHSHMEPRPAADLMARYFFATLGWPAMICGVVGLCSLARRRRWLELAIVAGPVLLFVGFFATRVVFFERNLSHVAPLFFVLAAGGAVAAAEWIAARFRWPTKWAIALLVPAVAFQPAQLTARFIGFELSGRATEDHGHFDDAVRAKYHDAKWWPDLLLSAEPLDRLAEHFRTGGKFVLLRVTDYADEATAKNLQALSQRFAAESVADYPGTFPELPPCTLLTYHTAHDRYFLVHGEKHD